MRKISSSIRSFGHFLVTMMGKIGKRKRFIISTIILSFLMLMATFMTFKMALIFLIAILLLVYLLTFFSILDGITRHEWITLFIAPIYVTIAFFLFYFFIPQRWLTRLPFTLFYAVSIYAVLLSQNIFNVGVTKSLQLFRAASSVNYLFLTISSYLMYSLILSMRLEFYLNFLVLGLATYPIALQFLWSVQPKDVIERRIRQFAFFITLVVAEVGLFLSFSPMSVPVFALLLTAIFYSLSGLFQAYLQERLFRERIREYTFVIIFVITIAILAQ